MSKRKDNPQKAAMRELMREYLKNNDIRIKSGTDVNSIMRDMVCSFRRCVGSRTGRGIRLFRV